MIYDSLDNLALYRDIPALKTAIDYILSHDVGNLEPGKYEVDQERVFFSVQRYETKEEEMLRTEAHRKYIDLQIVLEGKEYVGFCPLKDCGLPVEEHTDHDTFFYQAAIQKFLLSEGMFMVLFPQEAHKPQISCQEKTEIHKIVFKIMVP